ncbi:MAG: hypothetical protein Q8Q18_02545 [bacterium]|nr:hypothetical protein [bacterium]
MNYLKQLPTIALALVLALGANYVLAVSTWTGATANPPDANAPAPITVSSVAQAKIGSLAIGEIDDGVVSTLASEGLGIFGASFFGGQVQIEGGPLQIQDGSEAQDFVLASDAEGVASWVDVNTLVSGGSGGDTLGSLNCSNEQIAEWNGSAWQCGSKISGGGSGLPFGNMQVFDESGTFTVPEGVDRVMIEVWGGGGGGSGGDSGGGGAYGKGIYPVTPDQIYSVTVGSGGLRNYAGGTSSFGSLISAGGGSGGNPVVSNYMGTPGGTSNAPLNISGGKGWRMMIINSPYTAKMSFGGDSPNGGNGSRYGIGQQSSRFSFSAQVPGGGGGTSVTSTYTGAHGRVVVYY